MSVHFVIFSDLDATLLDHQTYSFQPACPVLKKIKKMGIPVVLCTSKTRAETEAIARKLGLNHPFIIENGGAIFIPNGYFADSLFKKAGISVVKKGNYRVIQLGTPYRCLRSVFKAIRKATGVRMLGFGDLTPEEIMAVSGLSKREAKKAASREYDEPFFLEKSPEFELIERKKQPGRSRLNNSPAITLRAESKVRTTSRQGLISKNNQNNQNIQKKLYLKIKQMAGLYGLRVTAGGRFYHLTGDNDKGRAVGLLKKLYRLQRGKIVTIGLGDSANDWPMLRVVELPVLVARPDSQKSTWRGNRFAFPLPTFASLPASLSRAGPETHALRPRDHTPLEPPTIGSPRQAPAHISRSLKIPGSKAHLLRTAHPGPEGWAEAVNFFLAWQESGFWKGRAPAAQKMKKKIKYKMNKRRRHG